MQSNTNTSSSPGSTITLELPAPDRSIFRSQAVHDLLYFLSRYHTDEFSITELTEAIEYSQPSVSNAVDVLVANELVVERREGNTRNVRINGGRLSRPDDPILQIPQSEYQDPVRAAIEQISSDLEGVIGIVLFGSVARGDADRRSDIDLWVLVEADRMANQRSANRIRQDLEEREFDTGRYAYEIDVEALPAVPNYVDELRDILSDGIVLSESEKFDTVRQMIFHGDLDE